MKSLPLTFHYSTRNAAAGDRLTIGLAAGTNDAWRHAGAQAMHNQPRRNNRAEPNLMMPKKS